MSSTTNEPAKSSDEILQELFGLCRAKFIEPSESKKHKKHSSREKHKKQKRKKHKKNKSRSRSYDLENDSSSDDETPVKKARNDEIEKDTKSKKIKYDSDEHTTTDKSITMVDVLNEMVNRDFSGTIEKIKSFKTKSTEDDNVDCKSTTEDDRTEILNEESDDPKLMEIKITNTENSQPRCTDTDRKKTGVSKIVIKDLKNSAVYEATVKEVEEKEKLQAEEWKEDDSAVYKAATKYVEKKEKLQQELEDGEVFSSSSDSDDTVERGETEGHAKKSDKSLQKESKSVKKKHHKKQKKRSRSKLRTRHESRSKRRSPIHSRRDRSPTYSRRDGSRHERRRRSRSRRRSHSNERHRRSSHQSGKSSRRRSRSKEQRKNRREESVEKIDKHKLLQIARKNAINMLKEGTLPASVIYSKDKLISFQAGGKTVDELTDFCKKLSNKEDDDNAFDSDNEDSEDESKPGFHHPFQIKERSASGIVMNIRNSVSLPIKSAQEKTLELSKQLSLQFPVSSGQHHKIITEIEAKPPAKTKTATTVKPPETKMAPPLPLPPPPPLPLPPTPPMLPTLSPVQVVAVNPSPTAIPQLPISNFTPPEDIDSIVTQRLEAMRKMYENPADQMINNHVKMWAESRCIPGQFTGSTGVKFLTPAQLGAAGNQAWAKQSQFSNAKPVSSDKGEALMKKMGWQPGEGLGKYKQGPSVPFQLHVKTDRKGLDTLPKQHRGISNFKPKIPVPTPVANANNAKHPVSILNEYCSQHKIGVPEYTCEEINSSNQRKLFLMRVKLQDVVYTPLMASTSKKQSKLDAAAVCLQKLGITAS